MSFADAGPRQFDPLIVRLPAAAGATAAAPAGTASYFRWKGAIDRTLALLLLIPALPLLGLLALLVRLTSRGPGIYRQARTGKDSRVFTMYKIRTMRHDAEAATGAVWTQRNDRRVTPVGVVLRKLHLDELPQLFNVVKGEMSLIGPRPERPEFVERLAKEIPGYLGRLAVLPGITGLAQVNLDPDLDLDDVRRKLVLDLEYVHSAGVLLDLRILLCTLLHLLGISGERARDLMRLRRNPAVGDRLDAPQRPLVAMHALTHHGPSTVRPLARPDRSRFACTRKGDPRNLFTVDVEDYFHVSAFERHIPRSQWSRFESRVVPNTLRILDLMDDCGVKGTFFVLGWVADRHPHLVREIHGRGHEIGSHGYWHRLIYTQSPKEFRSDLCRSRDVLADLTGRPVTAYRAPSFSITSQSLWALEILAEEGFHADSSIFPARHHRYGIPRAKREIHAVATSRGPLWEFPPSVVRLARMNIPIGGGGYFRLYPLSWTLRCMAAVNRRMRRPFVFYVHPWEIDPQQPRLDAGSWVGRFRHRVNLRHTEQKLSILLRSFRFARLCDMVRQGDADEVSVA